MLLEAARVNKLSLLLETGLEKSVSTFLTCFTFTHNFSHPTETCEAKVQYCLQVLKSHFVIIPFPHSGEPRPLSRTRFQLQAKDVPQVLLSVSLLVSEDTQTDTLRGQPQNADGFIMSGLTQVYTINLKKMKDKRNVEKMCLIHRK